MRKRIADGIPETVSNGLLEFCRFPGGFRNQIGHLDREPGCTVICENPDIRSICFFTVFGHHLKNRIFFCQIFSLNCPDSVLALLDKHHVFHTKQFLWHREQCVHCANAFRPECKIKCFQGSGNCFQCTAPVKFLGGHFRELSAIHFLKRQFVICQIIQD